MSNIFQNIKDRLNFRELVRFYCLYLNRGGFALCPFNNERAPCFKVYEDHFCSFDCREHRSHTDFVRMLLGYIVTAQIIIIQLNFNLPVLCFTTNFLKKQNLH
ncbi:CHC2 zinc finger domain-containing protein [Ruminococcus albus]|uniref:CHC2 zinc finger n=1 Tax=Ruminococcus albus TaxID=1264 RepID=A0A1H7GRT4_RUMAL|nr:CHC2 zinc finger domain-containing protein [Ruminococcus albus]SEK40781.1 CHC2 zinc finger [Ruminococcus albus]